MVGSACRQGARHETTALEITADGTWTIEVRSIDDVVTFDGSLDGSGDEVSMAKLMSSLVANRSPRWWPTKVLGHGSFRVVRWVSR